MAPTPDSAKTATTPDLFQGGGEMGALMRAYNWDAHPLGRPENWPQSLQTNIRLLLNSDFPMFIWWSADFYMFHNDAYLPALGNKHPKALGASARDMWAEIWHQLGIIAEGIMQDARPFYAENLRIVLDRKGFLEETYWTFSYSPAFGDAGQVAGMFCACFEVTDTVQSQRRLKAMKDITDAATPIFSIDEACQSICQVLVDNPNDIPFSLIYLLSSNGTQARLAGQAGEYQKDAIPSVIDMREKEQSESCPFGNVIQTRQMAFIDLAELKERLPDAAATASQAVIYPILRPGHDELVGFFISGLNPMLEYNAGYRNFHELLVGKIATSISILQAREEMIYQQEYLQNIFQQSPVGIAILRGPDFIIDLANPEVCEIWGREPAEVLHQPVIEALPEISSQGILDLLNQVHTTGQPFIANELPVRLKRRGQLETVYLNFLYHPMRDTRGNTTGVIAVAIDISEQVASRHEIETINRQLLAINADLDNFVYSASHDLKAPISNIEGLMQLLREYLPEETLGNQSVQLLIGHINSSIERFKRAVADLSEVAKIERQGGEDITCVHLPEVVAEVALDFDMLMRETGARLETCFAEGSTIRFSAKNIRSIVYNLLSNALKYRSPDRPPRVTFSTQQTPDHLILSVTDNGLGISTGEENKIFSMFKRLHDHVEGSGIGLYIVKKIVENAGGSIEVASDEGKGSTFRIYFKH